MAEKRVTFNPGDIPSKPGVYIFRDRFGTVIYVGKASNLRHRVSHYFQASRKSTSDPKLRSLINSIYSWECHAVRNEDESLILESRLIKDYAPRYNVLLRDDKRFFLIKINLHAEYPRLIFARVRKDDNCRYFGPFPRSGVLKTTVSFLTSYFGLRSCLPAVPEAKDHKHCMAGVVKDCCEPCIGKVSLEEYSQKVAAMMGVLEGNVGDIVCEVEERMQRASKAMNFEQAAKWRDTASNIREVFGRRNRSFRFADISQPIGGEALKSIMLILNLKSPPTQIECVDISNISGALAVGSMVCFENGRPCRKKYRRFRINGVKQVDDFAMMEEVVKRHYSRKLKEKIPMPGLLMVDGGKGQLTATIRALVALKCSPFPVIGLAKKNEEIFLPGKSKPLVLDGHSPALKLLQAVRDEAHRFAITYHRSLRKKKLTESILDEVPGIGPVRKRKLLKAFGSVRELRKADASEIVTRVDGIGDKFAKTLYNYFKRR